jgi:transmembrane 9 superfamily protein 3
LSITYNTDRIVEVNLTSENPVPIETGQKLQFTYSVEWVSTEKCFEHRFNRYLEYDFFEHKIHWFSVFNSFMMVIFLCGLVSLILLRTLRNDFARYAKDEDMDVEGMQVIGEDSGWKQVHGDVFRAPEQLILFSAMLGTGFQLVLLVLGVILYAVAGLKFVLINLSSVIILSQKVHFFTVICTRIEVKWCQHLLCALPCLLL